MSPASGYLKWILTDGLTYLEHTRPKNLVLIGLLIHFSSSSLPAQNPGAESDATDILVEHGINLWEPRHLTKFEQECWQTIRDLEMRPGTNDTLLGKSLNNLGLVYLDTGKYLLAEPLLRRAVAILETNLGRNHSAIASSLSNLAVLCRKQGKYLEARRILERVIDIRSKTLGPDHYDVARGLNTLAAVCHDIRDFSRAEQLSLRALTILEKNSDT